MNDSEFNLNHDKGGLIMEILYKPRRGGKTTELIKISAEKQHMMVCMSQKECSRVFQQAHTMKLDIPLPLTFDEFIKREYYGKGIKGFLIDNVDLLLQFMSVVPITAISITDPQSSAPSTRNNNDK